MCRRRHVEDLSLASCWRCRSPALNVGPHLFPKALHHILRISLRSLWDPIDDFKLTDVLEFGRLRIRLRLGFIDQVLEGGGS